MRNREKLENNEHDDVIGDVSASKLWKTARKFNPGTITYNFSTDGTALTESGRVLLWPAALHLNELPPKVRFKNIILAALFLTSQEPTARFMDMFFLANDRVKRYRY